MARPAGTARNGDRVGVFLAIADFPALVAGYRAVIDRAPGMEVVGELGHDDLGETVAACAAEVILTECRPAGADACLSFAAIETIHAARPDARILAIDCRCGGEQFSRAIRAGADGFLARDAGPGDVVEAVRRVAEGERYVSPTLVTRMVDTYVRRTPGEDGDDPVGALSERAREILRLAAVGHTNREIAGALGISEQTVHNHRAAIMEKLGVHDRIELLRYALRRGVIEVAEL